MSYYTSMQCFSYIMKLLKLCFIDQTVRKPDRRKTDELKTKQQAVLHQDSARWRHEAIQNRNQC